MCNCDARKDPMGLTGCTCSDRGHINLGWNKPEIDRMSCHYSKIVNILLI